MSETRPRHKILLDKIKWGAGIFCAIPVAIICLLIPHKFNTLAGRGLGLMLWHLLARERGKAVRNIADSLSSLKKGEGWQRCGSTPEKIARSAFANLGITFIELVKLYFGRGEKIIASVSFEGVENYRQAHALGKGVILISGHCGNWELMGFTVCRELDPMFVVARQQSNAFFNGVIEKLRNRYGSSVIYSKGAAKKIFFALRKEAIVGIIIDQVVAPSEGAIVEFLGRRAWMTNAPPAIAEKTGSPIVPFFIHRENGGHKVVISPPIFTADFACASEVTHKLNSSIEEYIRNHPDEWLWMYNRWKNID